MRPSAKAGKLVIDDVHRAGGRIINSGIKAPSLIGISSAQSVRLWPPPLSTLNSLCIRATARLSRLLSLRR